MKKILIVILASLLLVPPALAKKPPQMTPMELQAIQSREFEATKDTLFGAVMTVLQDQGYQLQSADLQTGFITGVSATVNKTNVLMAFAGMRASGNTKVTCFIQAMPGGQSRVRFNFLNTRNTSGQYGTNSQDDKPILDAAVYRNVWEKIDEALFVAASLEPTVPSATEPKSGASAPINPQS